MRKKVFISFVVLVVLGIFMVWHTMFGRIDRSNAAADAKVVSKEEKVLPGRMGYFISPYEDMKWASGQVEMLERASDTSAMSSEVVANLFEHSYRLTQYVRNIQRRVSLTEGSLVSRIQSGNCYSLYPVGGRKAWSDLHFYHNGFLEDHIKDSQNIIAVIERDGFCVRAVDFKRKEYSYKDVPGLLKGIEKTKGHISSFGVPSAASLLNRLDSVRWVMR